MLPKGGENMQLASLFKEVFYQSRTPQIITTLDENETVSNPAFLHFVGYSQEEWENLSIKDISHPDDYNIDYARFQEVINGERKEYQLEKRYICKNGVVKTAELHVSLIHDQNTYYILGQIIDLTEKLEMLKTKQKSEDQYRLIAENSSDIINLHDSDGTYVYLSPSIYSILGYQPCSLIGKHPYEIIHPDDIPSIEELIHVLHDKNKPLLITYRAMKEDGEYRWIESILKAIVDEETNHILNIISVSRDIEERVKTELNIKKSEKLAVLGQMAAAVAHEIRNPLTPIKGFLQLCYDKKQYNEEYLKIVVDEINRMEAIISDFLHLAKPQECYNDTFNLNTLLAGVVKMVSSKVKSKNTSILYESLLPSLSITGNKNGINQVFFNILQNAIDAVEDEGIILVRDEIADDYIRISIKDNGDGIPCEVLPHLGEPFYSTKEKGTGMGLLISHKIIENHGGKITFHTQKGSGTEVHIDLPYKKTDS